MKTITIKNYIEGDTAISYDDGERCYQDIKKEIEAGEEISLDFKDVSYVITAFLNPIIGDLIIDYGKETMEKVNIENAEKKILEKIKLVKEGALLKREDVEE